jgi:hypothetical protein
MEKERKKKHSFVRRKEGERDAEQQQGPQGKHCDKSEFPFTGFSWDHEKRTSLKGKMQKIIEKLTFKVKLDSSKKTRGHGPGFSEANRTIKLA